ncbi:MAG: hypothetical protein Kow00124_10660 [Anaerolineae bacterium]
MVKLIILLKPPSEYTDAYAEGYNNFLIALDALPGLRRKSVGHVFGGLAGHMPYSLVIEAYFDSRAALEQALLSPAGVTAGQSLLRLTGPNALALYADVLEEYYEPEPPDSTS